MLTSLTADIRHFNGVYLETIACNLEIKIKIILFLAIYVLSVYSQSNIEYRHSKGSFIEKNLFEKSVLKLENKTEMEFTEIISYQRSSYIKQLLKFYEKRNNGLKEGLMELNSESETLLFNLSRIDYIITENNEYKIEELTPETYTNHQKIDLNFGDLNIELNPFFWHGCELIIKSNSKENKEYEWLKKWTKKWIDEDDEFEINKNGLSGVIHNVSIPIFENNEISITVDLGSAPVEALIELLDIIRISNYEKVVLNSFDLIN